MSKKGCEETRTDIKELLLKIRTRNEEGGTDYYCGNCYSSKFIYKDPCSKNINCSQCCNRASLMEIITTDLEIINRDDEVRNYRKNIILKNFMHKF